MKTEKQAPVGGLLTTFVGVDLLGLGVYLALTGTDLTSLLGIVASITGFSISGYGVVLLRRALKQPAGTGRWMVDQMAARATAGQVRKPPAGPTSGPG